MKHEIELQPFRTPNFVLQVSPPGKREDGYKETPKYELAELSRETLEEMCAAFRAEVLTKAGFTP